MAMLNNQMVILYMFGFVPKYVTYVPTKSQVSGLFFFGLRLSVRVVAASAPG